jgi:hypothetical protein
VKEETQLYPTNCIINSKGDHSAERADTSGDCIGDSCGDHAEINTEIS